MPAIPLRGDRSAWDAANYRLLHANDIDLSASSIHHTIGTSANQVASGSHTHDDGGGGGGGNVSSDDYNNTWGGTNALENFTAGSLAMDNTAFGFEALDYLGYSGSSWNGNTAFGSNAAWWFESGDNNTFLGFNAGADSNQKNDPVNSMGLGANSYTTKDNQIVIGDDNIQETLLKGTVILNEIGSPTWDFRAESDNQEYMIFLDSSANKLYLGGLGNGIALSSSSVDIVTNSLTLNGAPISEALAPKLNDITDVRAISPNDGDVLAWNAASGSWVAYPAVDWRVALTQDETADDSDKTFTVPSSVEWQILWVWVEYTSTATGGSRQLEIQLQDASGNVIGQFQTGVTQTESLTYKYLFGIGVPDLTNVRDGNNVTTPLPAGTFLTAGQKIRIWDNKAIDSSADDMTVRIQYATRTTVITEVYYGLSVNSSSQVQTSDKVGAFTRHQILTINNTAQSQTSEKVALTQRYATLTIENSLQIQASENITLPPQTYGLEISNAIQTQASDAIALTQYHILVVQNVTQKETVETITLWIITHYEAIPQDTIQLQTAENTALIFYTGIIVDNSLQSQIADNTELFTDTVILVLNDSVQAQTTGIDKSLVTNIASLAMNNSAQVQTSDNVTFTNMTTLTMNNSVQTQNSNSAGLTQHQATLKVNNSTSKLITDNVTLFAG